MSRLERGIKSISELLRVIDPYSIVYTLRWFTTESAGFLRELATYTLFLGSQFALVLCTTAISFVERVYLSTHNKKESKSNTQNSASNISTLKDLK